MLYTGATYGMQLCQPLGDWNQNYLTHQFWHWQLADPDHLLFRHSQDAKHELQSWYSAIATTLSTLPQSQYNNNHS